MTVHETMYGSLRRRLWDEKDKMADNVLVAMESSDNQFVLRLYNDWKRHLYDFLLLMFYMSHILQPSNVAFALLFASTKPQSKPWLSYRRQWRHNVTLSMTRYHIFAPIYWLLIYLQCEWIFLFCGELRKQIKVLDEIKHLFGQFQTVHRNMSGL